jgi:hypothetical protein
MMLTAAEIAAAEAAAIAAAEAAAVHAAQVAAAQAAQAAAAQAATQAAATTAANTAAANTAAATATNAATNQSVLQAIGAGPAAPASAAQLGGYGAGAAGGIPTLGAGAGAGTGVAGGIPTLGTGAGTGANLGYETLAKEVSGIEQLVNAANYPLPSAVPTVPSVPNVVPPGAEYIPPSNFGAPPAPPTGDVTFGMGTDQVFNPALPAASSPALAATPAPPAAPLYGSAQPSAPPSMGPNTFPDIYRGDSSLYTIDKAPGYSSLNARPDLAEPSKYSLGNQAGNYNLAQTGPATPAAPQQPGGIEGLFNKGLDYAQKNPLTTLMGANTLGNYLNKPEPYEKEKYKSTFKPGLYTGYTPVQPTPYQPQYAVGGLADLGGYSDGGRMLKGPGDGMSDDIPATIANKQPARLANEEFVIPADVVSHLGNGSSEAGAKQLYKMMDRIRKARTGTKKQGKQINPEKYLA